MGSGGGGSYAHPSSPVSRFNSGILAINSSSAMTAGGSANIVTSPMAQGKFSVLRPTASRSGGLPFQHPLHSTAVQASHSVGQHAAQQKAAASNAQQAPNALPSSLRAAAAASSGGNGGSGSASPSAKKDRIGARKDSWGTFPRLGSAGGRVGSSGASPHSGSGSNSVTDQMASGSPAMRASPTGVGRSPEPAALGAAVLLTSAMLHPRPTTGTRDGRVGGMKVARTPPTTHKKRPHAERRVRTHTRTHTRRTALRTHMHARISDMRKEKKTACVCDCFVPPPSRSEFVRAPGGHSSCETSRCRPRTV